MQTIWISMNCSAYWGQDHAGAIRPKICSAYIPQAAEDKLFIATVILSQYSIIVSRMKTSLCSIEKNPVVFNQLKETWLDAVSGEQIYFNAELINQLFVQIEVFIMVLLVADHGATCKGSCRMKYICIACGKEITGKDTIRYQLRRGGEEHDGQRAEKLVYYSKPF